MCKHDDKWAESVAMEFWRRCALSVLIIVLTVLILLEANMR